MEKSKNKSLLKGLFIAFAAFLTVSCATSGGGDNGPKIPKRYILNGDYLGTHDEFDYYDIGNNEVAISLKDEVKTSYTDPVVIPSKYNGRDVTGIWHNAFHNCPATSITIPNSITVIDFEAFLYSGIVNVSIPYSVEEIGVGAFYACGATNVTIENSNQTGSSSVIDCGCDEEEETPTGDPVYCDLKVIPAFCFFKCNSLVTLSIPASIQEIGEEAFNGCSKLESGIYFHDIRIIRSRAFQGCTSLENIYISNSLFKAGNNGDIEEHAFNYCNDRLDIAFCGTSSEVTTWVNNHKTWGWNTDTGNPNIDKYNYRLETGDSYFSADWIYTCDANNNVTITKYNGPDPINGYISVPDSMDAPAGNYVRYINVDAFDEVKSDLSRLYLPTTLWTINNLMFRSGYNNLYVVDSNKNCATDLNGEIKGRINLSDLTELEFIGQRAFSGIGGNNNKKKIKSLHLPAHLRSIGNEAFGIFGQRMLPAVDTFEWDYDNDSILETVGADAFYGLGYSSGSGEITGNEDYRNKGVNWEPSTLIFPKTFKYFGVLTADYTRYKTQAKNPFDMSDNAIPSGERASKRGRPAHAFLGCSLIGKVLFKGSSNSSETSDLIIPLQTFVYNEALQTIVFEERAGRKIVFHTQSPNYHYAQESIGGNSGRGKNDFRGEPFLQTIVLPNVNTDLYFQDFSFHANSRAVMYFSGTYGSKMYRDNANGDWTQLSFSQDSLTNANEWNAIGSEKWHNSTNQAGYYGYCFTDSTTGNKTGDESVNTFCIDQNIPYYDNVHYKDSFISSNGVTVNTEVGSSGSGHKEYHEENKCSFICEIDNGENKIATMTNYLFNLHDGSTSEELKKVEIPDKVDVSESDKNYIVTKIGESAFSACYCDGKDTDPDTSIANVDNLNTVIMPNTIDEIKDYAFIRAYGVTTIKSYDDDPDSASEGMPSDLKKIGKLAFAFCGITQILKIPYECLFYENYTDVENTKEPSTFSNSVDLRKITFLDSSEDEGTTSKYYSTTTYNSGAKTCALYSTNEAGTWYNKNRLLLVLNRNSSDKKAASGDGTVNTDDNGIKFNGLYKTNNFLFGAFKMGYWIRELICGNPTTNGSGNKFTQSLFAAIGNRGTDYGNLTAKPIYLNTADYTFVGLKCDVDTITNAINQPRYAFNGCEKLLNVELDNANITLPDGLFANNTNTETNYKTSPAPEGGDAHVLDLTSTTYKGVGKETFKNNKSIHKLVAPSGSFTIGTSAFEGCSNLATLDFRNVTGKLTINTSAFKTCGITDIIWPTNTSTVVEINGSAFDNCDSLENLSLPVGLKTLGGSAFSGCDNLTNVTTQNDSNLTSLTSISGNAFNSCKKIVEFPFDKLTALTSIGESAFNSAGKLSSDGAISLPASLTSIGKTAFKNSAITSCTINSSSINLGESSFESCTSMTSFRFSDEDCAWTNYNKSVFNSCTALTELQLPSGFNEANTTYNNNNYLIQGDTNINIYLYKKYTGTGASEGWRKIASGNFKPVHYLVLTKDDLSLVITDTPTPAVTNTTTEFWTTDAYGAAINLGTVTAYDGTTVTFSSGYTLTGTNTFNPPA